MARTRCYRAGVLSDENFPLADVSVHLDEQDAVVWIDLCAPDLGDLRLVADELGVHELAVEDAVEALQRPKLDRYPDHAFLSTYGVSFDPVTAVHAEGLKYPLDGLRLSRWWQAALNEASGDGFSLRFKGGPLLIYQTYAL